MAEPQNPLLDSTTIPVSPNFPERIFTPPTVGMRLVNPITGQPTSQPAGQLSTQIDEFEWMNKYKSTELKDNPLRSLIEATPVTFKPAEVNFDRYVNHPKFKELGFYPYADNESYYNKNSTLWDDVARATPQMLTLAGLGLTAGVRSMGNLLSGNPSFDDTQLADEFGNAVAIGQSTRGGLGAWVNNFGLNSAYTVGILGELAIEEAALVAATPLSGGASTVAAGVRLGQAGRQLRSAWKAFGTVDAARDFYKGVKGVGSAVGTSLIPNTLTWAKGIKSADNLKDFATVANGFGNFYRDLRTVNLTLDESNMEGGFAFNEIRDSNIARKRQEVGRDLTPEELAQAERFAADGALTTRLTNIPFIYATNAITFDNAFRGFGKYLSSADAIAKAGGKQLTIKSAQEIAEGIAKGSDDVLKSVAKVEDVSILKDLKNPRKWANLGFKYTKGNLSEGIQELGQEFVQGAAVDYYTSIYNDNRMREYYGTVYGDQLIAANNILSQSIKKSASDNVFSGQGFDTFLQGFLTGGLIGGGRRVTTAIFDRTINKKEAAEKAKVLEDFAKTINESALSTRDYIDFLNKENLVTQKEAFFEMNMAEAAGDQKAALDAKRQAVRTNAYRLFASGNYKYYKSFLEDLKGLTPEELNKLFSNTTEKGAEKIEELISNMDQLEKNYSDVQSRFGQPFNPSKFNKEKEPEKYVQELSKYFAWEEEKKKIVFAKDFMVENAQRMQKIVDTFPLKGEIADAAYSDFAVLFSEQSRKSDIQLLKQEIDLLEGAEELSQEQKEILKEKKARYEALDVFQSNLQAIRANASKKQGDRKGKLNKKEYEKLFKQYEKYVKTIGAKDQQSIKDSFDALVDHYLLSDESAEIADTINTLVDPSQMMVRTERVAAIFKEIFANRKKIFEDSAKKYVNQIEKNQLVNDLAAIGVQPDLDSGYSTPDGDFISEYDMFMLIGKRMQSFVTEDGPLIPGTDLYNKAQSLVDEYEKNSVAKSDETVAPETTEVEQSVVAREEFVATEASLVTKDQETNEFKFATPLNKYLTDIINKVYTDESSRRQAAGTPMPSFISWLNGKQGRSLHDAFLALQERFLKDNPSVQEDYDFNELLNWLSKNKGNVFVIDTLSAVGLDVSYLMSKYQDRSVFDKSKLKANQKLVSGVTPLSGVFVVSTTVDDVTTYEVVNFENRNLLSTEDQDAVFETLQAAVDAQVEYAQNNKETADTFVFDGTVFTTGQVWNDGLNDYKIVSKPSEMSTPNARLKAQNIETGQEKIFAKSRLLLPGARVDGKDSNRSYLLSLDKYSSVHANVNDKETREDAQKRLSNILANTPKEELLAGLSVVVRPNPNYDKNKRGYLQVEDKAANPYIIEKSPKYYIEVKFNGETIGWLDTLQDVDFVNNEGKIIPAKDVTFELFQEFSNVKGNPFENFRQFKSNLYNGFALWKNAEKLMQDSGNEAVTLSGKDIEEQLGKLVVGRSQYVYGNATMNELAFNQLDGGYFIIEQRRQKKKGTITASTRYITTGEYTDEQRVALEEEIERNKDRYSSLGRYVLAARQPNGNLVFIELKLPRLNEGQVSEVINKIKKRSEYVKANEESFVQDQTENNEGFNSELLDSMFVALPTSNLYVVPSLNQNGDLVITLAKDAKGMITVFEKIVSNVSDINTGEDLIALMNEAITEARQNNKTKVNVTVTADSLQAALGQTVTANDIVQANFVTNVAPEVVGLTKLRGVAEPKEKPAARTSAEDIAVQHQKSQALAELSGMPVPEETPAVQPTKPANSAKSELLSQMSNLPEAAIPAEPVVVETAQESKPFLTLEDEKKAAWRDAYMAAIAEGKSKADAAKSADVDPKVIQLTKEINEALDSASEQLFSFKQASGFTPEDQKSMLDFLDFVKKNLPDYFVVEQLETLEKNFKTGAITLGKFYASVKALSDGVEINGILQVSAISPAKYHEAFHGLFRLLLNDQQISKLLASAKREKLAQLRKSGKSLATAVSELKATNPEFYSQFTEAQMEDLVYEEYLADAFESWKKDKKFPTDASHKSFFNRLIEWIRMILGLSNRNDIVNLFQDFDSGKFAKAAVASNRFTKDFTNVDAQMSAFKQILGRPRVVSEPGPDGKPVLKKYSRFFSGPAAVKLTSDIAAVVNKKMTTEKKSREDILDSVLQEYKLLYNLSIPDNYDTYAERFGEDFNVIREQIEDLFYVVNEKTEELKESILSFMSSAGYQERNYEDVNEDVADSEGDGVAENKIAERGGMSGLSTFVRTYLGSITRNTTDQFGNTEFFDGTPMVQSVEVSHIYNGLLNALAGQTDVKKSLLRLYHYAQGNPDTEAVVDTFFNDTGITIENGIVEGPTKNVDLYQKVMKGFEQFSINYKFIAVNNNTGDVLVYDSNRKDRSNVQLSLWQQAYSVRSAASRKVGATYVEKLASAIKEGKDLSNTEVNELIRNIAINTGIHLHPSLVNYSLAAAKVTNDNATPEDIAFVNSFSEIEPIAERDLTEIQRNLTDGADVFLRVIDKNDSNEVLEGSFNRLKAIASSNVFFDETVSSTSWKNAEGETVWNHQYGTYALIAVERLKDSILNGTLEQDPFYLNNLLLSNPQFMSTLADLKLERIDGIAQRILTGNEGELFENKDLEVNREAGKTFGRMDSVEFLASILALGSTVKKKTFANEVTGVLETFAVSTHIPSILEASSTSNIVDLPVTKYFGAEGKLTKKGGQAIRNEIEREFASMQRARVEAERGVNLIKDYHTGKERGFKFNKMAPYMESDFIAYMEEQAKNPNITFTEALSGFEGNKNITAKAFELLKAEADEFIKILVDEGGLRSTVSQGSPRITIPKGSFVPAVFRDGHSKDGVLTGFVANNLKQNLYQFYINDLMNSFAWNQLTKGDSVRNVKDAIDEVKRNKGEGAGGYAAYTEATSPELGINHATKEMSLFTIKDPLFIGKYASALKGSEQKKEQADAQMWITAKSFRHLKFGFGELDKNFADLLNKIDKGIALTDEEIFGSNGMVERGTMLNSIKVVYYNPVGNGKYVKTSAFVLTKELTSVKDASGNWQPLAGYEDLHNIREALEAYEQENAETLTGLIPESASKLSKQNTYADAASLVQAIGEKVATPSTLDMRLMFLQQKNPSNKLSITDPSQNKQIINLDIDRNVVVNFNGKATSLGEISDLYESLSSARYELKYTTKRNKIFTVADAESIGKTSSKNVTVDLAELYKYAQETLNASGRGAQAEYFELDENNTPRYDHNNPIVQEVFVEMMLSFLSKGVLQEKVPGHTLTLVSDYGVNIVREVIGGTARVVRRNKLSNNANLNSLALAARNVSEEDYNVNSVKGSKEGDLVIDRLRFDVGEIGSDGKPTGRRYAEVMLPAHFREIMTLFADGEIPAAISEMLGIRIPTQDKHSAMFIKVVDFLPAQYGSVIVSPRELIEISGADFDIDKLYTLIKQWYVDKTSTGKIEVREYGKAETAKGKFKDFINYTLRENKDFKSAYKLLNPDNKEALSIELEAFNATGILSNDVKALLNSLNLPSTAETYDAKESSKGAPLYEGALNNLIVDAKSHLLYNPETTSGDLPPAYQPADISPLQDVLKELKDAVSEFDPAVAELLFDEKNYNTSGALGKFKARKSNKEGSVGIGPTVNALLQWAFLAKGGKDYLIDSNFKAFSINGKTYNSYVNRYDDKGARKGFVLSTLITAMVDNAKERMAERLGLSIEALGVVSHLTALGVNLKDSILFVNHPKVKEYYKQAANNKNIFTKSTPASMILKDLIAAESAKIAEGSPRVTRFTSKDIEEAIANSGQNPSLNVAVLEALSDQLEMTRYFGAISKIVKLVKGFSPDMASFDDVQANIDLLYSEGSPYDLDEYLKASKMYNSVVNIYSDIRKLMPAVLISKSGMFSLMLNSVMNSVNIAGAKRRDIFKNELESSILSYLTLKNFIRNGRMSPTLRSALTNSTIYADANSAESAIHSLVTLREKYPKNYFINNYLIASPYDGDKNRTLLDLIESNSWTKLNEDQKLKIQYSILELASDMKARKHFDKLIAYLMVKDGLQFKSGSFLNIVPPILLGSYFESARSLTRASKTGNKAAFEELFGESIQDTITDFTLNYMVSAKNSFYLPFSPEDSPLTKLDFVRHTPTKLIVDMWPKDNVLLTIGGDLLFDEKGNPLYADDGESYKIETSKEEKMDSVSDKVSKLTKATKLFEGRGKVAIAKPVIKIGNTVYKIVAVKRFGDKSGKIYPIDKNGNLANKIYGNYFEYQKVDIVGSKAQFGGGWSLFGPVPTKTEVNPFKKAEVTNPQYTPDVKSVPAAAVTITSDAPKKLGMPNDLLLDNHGILVEFDKTSRKFTYTDVNTGEAISNYNGLRPVEVLAMQPKEFEQPSSEDAPTVDNTRDSALAALSQETPAMELADSKISTASGPKEKLTAWYNSLSQDVKDSKFAGLEYLLEDYEYAVKNSGITVDQFIASQEANIC
jgi:hypothetical protein